MNSPLLRFKLFTAFLLSIAVFYSCTKIITTDIGSGLIPPVDGVITKDTVIEISTKNLGFDTVSVGISDDQILGYIDDEIFGKTTASINFQVTPGAIPLSLRLPKNEIVVDSVVLALKYKGVWGDTSSHLKLHVYKMDPEVVFKSSIYYNNTQVFTKGPELTESGVAKDILIPALKNVDTTRGFFTEVTTNQLRIRLNKSFGEEIIGFDSSSAYTSDSAFYGYLRGIIVEPEASGDALIRIGLTDTSTRLSLYYHKVNGGDTISVRLAPRLLTSASAGTSTSASANTILRNYAGTQIPEYINRSDSNQDVVFMQTSPGTRAFINISKVKNMPNVIVHRAEVLMYQIPDAETLLRPPNLFLAAYNQDSMHQFLIPYDINYFNGSISNLVQFGVAPKLKNSNYYYSFDISRYVQGIITRRDTLYNLILSAPYNQFVYITKEIQFAIPISSPALNNVGIGRIRLGGGNNSNSQYKMRLHIVYSLPS